MTKVSIVEPYEPPPAMVPGDIAVRLGEDLDYQLGGEVTVHANDIVVHIISNDDGTVYIEAYAYHVAQQAVVSSAFIDAYKTQHPSITFRLADRPEVKAAREAGLL